MFCSPAPEKVHQTKEYFQSVMLSMSFSTYQGQWQPLNSQWCLSYPPYSQVQTVVCSCCC